MKMRKFCAESKTLIHEKLKISSAYASWIDILCILFVATKRNWIIMSFTFFASREIMYFMYVYDRGQILHKIQ